MLNDEYGAGLDGEGKKCIQVIRSNADHITRLLEDVVSFFRSGSAAIAKREVDMEVLARSVADGLEKENPKGSRIQIQIRALPRAYGDPSLLQQVFVNLLSNAVKFTRTQKKPQIEVGWVEAKRSPAGITTYFVRDNGIGFNMKEAEKLFDPFQRLHSASQFEGTGLGLSIVKNIIERHGGRVWADAQPGSGATFSFTLPEGDDAQEAVQGTSSPRS